MTSDPGTGKLLCSQIAIFGDNAVNTELLFRREISALFVVSLQNSSDPPVVSRPLELQIQSNDIQYGVETGSKS